MFEVSEFQHLTKHGKWRHTHVTRDKKKTVCGEKIGADWEIGDGTERGTVHCENCLKELREPVKKRIVGS